MAAELTLTVTPVSGSADAAANTSRVRIGLAITTSQGTWSHDYTTEGDIRLDGAAVADLNGKWVDINTATALYSGEHTVTHDTDGTKTVTVEACFNVNTDHTKWVYAQQTVELPAIPRASVMSSIPNIILGAGNAMAIRASAEQFTHTVTYRLGSASGTVCTGVPGGVVPWTPDISLCAQLPHSASGFGTLTLHTYNGGEEIGCTDYPFAAYVPTHVVPTVEQVTAVPVNDNGTLAEWGVCVKGKSRLQFSVSAQGAYGSAVTDGAFACAGGSGSGLSGTTGVLVSAGSFAPQVTVKDTRQRTSAVHYGETLTVYDYDVPSITASSVQRSDAAGAPDGSGSCLAVQCSAVCAGIGGRNRVSVRVRTRPYGGAWSAYAPLENGVLQVLPEFEVSRSYEVECSAVDELGECKAVVYAVPTESVAFMLGDGGMAAAFGKYPEQTGLDMGWDIHMNGRRITDLPAPAAAGDAVPWSYAEGRYAPGGYGLGTTGAYRPLASWDELNTLVYDGWYAVNFTGTVTVDGLTFRLAVVEVRAYTADYVYQKITPLGYFCVMHRSSYAGVWSPVAWDDPPGMDGIIYRTTRRFRGLPVYETALPLGQIGAGEHLLPHGLPLTYPIRLEVTGDDTQLLTGSGSITELKADRTYIRLHCTGDLGNVVLRVEFV